MPCITDQDLLNIEPTVFTDAATIGVELISGADASVTGIELTSAGSDFAAAGVTLDSVLVLAGVPLDVIAVTSSTQLDVSRVRVSDEDDPIPPNAGPGQDFAVLTFTSQIVQAEAWVFGALGMDPTDPSVHIDESAILNIDDLCRLIALRTIWLIFATAAARDTLDDTLATRANLYQQRATNAQRQTSIVLDLDSAGSPASTRRIDVVSLLRV